MYKNGIREILLTDEELTKYYQNKELPSILGLERNEYLLFKYEYYNENGRKKFDYLPEKFKYNGTCLVPIEYKSIRNLNDKKGINPRNIKQELAFDLLQDSQTKVKLLTGSQGGGKTFLSTIHAISKIEKSKINKIVYIRNNIEVANTEKLGALPNGLQEKLMPFIMPLIDILGKDGMATLQIQEKIEFLHLGHARGRSFSNSVVIVSEAENLTREHVALLIGRVGENSIIIFEGDTSQVDKRVFAENSGIQAIKDVLKGNPLFGAIELDKSERSDVSELANLFYQEVC